MPQSIQLEVEMPGDLARFRLPAGVQHRLQELLDKQDAGLGLSAEEKREAEGLVDLADLLSLLRSRTERLNGSHAQAHEHPANARRVVIHGGAKPTANQMRLLLPAVRGAAQLGAKGIADRAKRARGWTKWRAKPCSI
jgi:hypothetical protein